MAADTEDSAAETTAGIKQSQNLELLVGDEDIRNFTSAALEVELDRNESVVIRNEIWRLVLVLVLGQLLSLCLAVASFTSSYIANLGSVVLVCHLGHRRCTGKLSVCKGISVLDYYKCDTTGLLDYTMGLILTWFVLRTHYSLWQLFGAVICVVGLVLVLLSDARVSSGGGRNPLLGDTLVIAATFCYALSNVGEEFCVKKKDQIEVVAMLGLFGVLVSACEISIFERKALASVKWSPTTMSGSTLFNLSLLTSDIWAVLIRIFFYKQQVNWLYYLAFAVVAVGLVTYSLNDTTSSARNTETTWHEESKPLTEDNSIHEEVLAG